MKLEKTFRPELTSRLSKAFNYEAVQMKENIDDELVKSKISNFIGIEILEMRNGSIIVDFVAVYNTSITTSQSKLNETLSSLIASGAIKNADPKAYGQVQGISCLNDLDINKIADTFVRIREEVFPKDIFGEFNFAILSIN